MQSMRVKLAAIAATGLFIVSSIGITAANPGQKKGGAKAAGGAGNAAAGKKVYAANGCKACHVIGADKGGKTGPELTHVGKTKKADYLMAKVRTPKKANPKSTMPAYPADKINDKDLKDLVAYMVSLK